MAFQPIVDLRDRRIDAYEALARSTDGRSAASVLAQINTENIYAFDQACCVKSLFEKGQLWAIRRSNRLPMATWIMASDTSSRVS
jgi:predicted signal transduction protein with EAL and GGDEF domain